MEGQGKMDDALQQEDKDDGRRKQIVNK